MGRSRPVDSIMGEGQRSMESLAEESRATIIPADFLIPAETLWLSPRWKILSRLHSLRVTRFLALSKAYVQLLVHM